MTQQPIRDFNNETYSIEEGAALITELNERTRYGVDGYNSILELGVKVAQLEAVESADGNHAVINRANEIEDVAPTAAEVENPVNGDTVDINLNNIIIEKWVVASNNWAKRFKFSIAETVIVAPTEEQIIGNVYENLNAQGAIVVDFTQVSHADLVFTANGSLSITPPNLANGKSKTVSINVIGDFTVAEPANFAGRKNQDRDQTSEAFYAITYWKRSNGTLKLKVTIDNMEL